MSRDRRGGAFRVSRRAIFVLFALFCVPQECEADPQPDKVRLPPGFEIGIYASNVPGARSMTLSPNGTLFVGTRDGGNVYALLPHGKSDRADEVVTIARDLNMPNGVAFRDGALFVAEVNRVLRYDGIESRLKNPPKPVVVNDRFPRDRHHGWKFIRFGPDGMLYVPVGAPCNVCEEKDPRYASIMRMRPDGAGLEIFARGVRNTVGFDWDPVTKELWFTDNGRDWMGDDKPPDELNRAPRKGMHFGFPYRHGRDIPDPEFGRKMKAEDFTKPELVLGPHVASLGMRFYTGTMFPPGYRNQIFIAEHGSWNRSVPIGYRVTLVRLRSGRAASYEVFAEGWLQGRSAWGRPVDVQVMPDGALLVSDDKAGAIYRISYKGRPATRGRTGKKDLHEREISK
ncbi:MAG: sorbosone dehydrogenase family protein [Deltaproteobacteria bacterium]|nr:sorbosone dehydrogenase family protein [Deltaproteobacteria bacterium]